MTPEQALEILKQVASLAPINLATHQQWLQAADVLKRFVDDHKKSEPAKEDKK